MTIPRRTFLLQAGGALAGFSALGCEDAVQEAAAAPPPKTLTDALERMRKENKAGIALRLTTDKARHSPGHMLVRLLNKNQADSRETFAEVAFVCLESPVLQAHLKGADSDHNLVVFDEDGRVEAGVRFDYGKDWDRFGSVVLSLAHGPDNSRLKKRAEAIRKKAEPDVVAALDRLGAPGADLRADAAILVREAPRIVPLLVHARLESTSKARQEALRGIIDQVATSSGESTLPYGIQTMANVGGCGDHCLESAESGMIACGMARAEPNSRSFVKYLTQ